jgi:predicted porin
MSNFWSRFQLLAGASLPALMLVLGTGGCANAQAANDEEIKALRAQVEQLQRTVSQLVSGQAQSSTEAKAAHKQADQAQAQAAQAHAEASKAEVKAAQASANAAPFPAKSAAFDDFYFQHKKGSALTFATPGGEITGYGNLDVSFDDTSKNVSSLALGTNGPPVGNFGWMPAISTNLSYVGVRGFQRINDYPFNFVYQLEVGFDISATPGLKQTNSNLSDTVNGALFNRNTYIGLSSSEWGAIKIGKTDAPYKNSTAAFNPFSGQIGDYSVIMGNTGGDNRVEFGTRLDHAIWYESPTVGGFQFNALFAPGQNRDNASGNIPAGGSDCTGGNDPTSGGNLPIACNDGAFSNAVSANLSYTNGPFYATVAYEWHQNVNRQSDISAIYGFPLPNAYAQNLFNESVANEDAAKVAVMYQFATKTTVGAIFESMHRYVPADLQFQNERQRYGTWLVVSQQLTDADSVHFGWAHAFAAPGDPGQHNTSTLTTVDGAGNYAPNDNQADMVTASYKHKFSPNLTWYAAVAATFNGPSAHYDLGAGGRGVTTDCHDASDATGGAFSNPHCYAGTTLAGVSTGLQWKF